MDEEDGAWFVGIWGFLDGGAGWNGVSRSVRAFLDTLQSYPKTRLETKRKVEGGRTEEQKIKKLEPNRIASLVNEVKKGKVMYIHARTSWGELDSFQKGQWWWWGIGNEFQDEPEEVRVFGTFPVAHFVKDEASEGTEKLIGLLEKLTETTPIIYLYSNLGNRSEMNPPLGMDRLYSKTRFTIPVSNFDYSKRPGSLYVDSVVGIFWLNVLNPTHVKAVGGVSRIEEVAQPHSIQSLPNDRTMILTTPSPLVEDNQENREAFFRLRRVLEPLSLCDREIWRTG